MDAQDFCDLLLSNDWDADELLRSVLNGGDVTTTPTGVTTTTTMRGPTLASSPSPLGTTPMSVPSLGSSSLNTPTLETPDDMDDLKDLVGLPFDTVLDSGASDSGMSSDASLDQQMSPLSVASPGSFVDMGLGIGGFSSPDSGADTISEVSSVSDLGSSSPHSSSSALLAAPNSPETILGADDFIAHPDSGFSSPVPQIVPDLTTTISNNISNNTLNSMNFINSVNPSTTHAPTLIARTTPLTTKVTPVCSVSTATPLLKTVTVGAAPTSSNNNVNGQTIVVTQASKGGASSAQIVRGGTLLKSNPNSRSILLPVTVKDLNQVRTIKIISTGSANGVGVNGRNVRTVVSTVRANNTTGTTTTSNPAGIRTALLTTVRNQQDSKYQDSKSLLKGSSGATVVTSTRTTSSASLVGKTPLAHASPPSVKSDYEDDDDDDDDEARTSFQQLTLSDEEKRLLKKEGITLPTHYPLTKLEERELKRIRRKIRNKISAQDSRKRKKEYIDGLEDRVKACTEENQQLQKRIRTLEAQNESLLVQMRKFQNAVIGGSNNGRSQAHASTALMMLILSAALFIVPSLRQDGNVADSELSLPSTKMPNAGHTRNLLEVGSGAIVPSTLEALETVEDDMISETETPLVQALTDHDYTPAPKRMRTFSKTSGYYVPPLDDYPPQIGKTDSGGGFPPDDGLGAKIAARIMDDMVEYATNNFSDPGGKNANPQAVVVNLGKGQKRLREDLELE